MAYNSLTQAPRNLKEGIDWLIALKGDDFQYHMEEMGAAVYDLLEDKPVGFTEVPVLEEVKRISKEFMEQEALKDEWSVKRLLGRFSKRMNKTGLFAKRGKNDAKSEFENIVQTQKIDPDAIASYIGRVVYDSEQFLNKIKAPGKYKSAYTSEATWEKSCSEKPEDCAAVLVGIMPMLYVGLRSVWDSLVLAIRDGPNSDEEKRLERVLKAVGFDEPECRAELSTADAIRAFKNVDIRIFTLLYDLAGFWAFY